MHAVEEHRLAGSTAPGATNFSEKGQDESQKVKRATFCAAMGTSLTSALEKLRESSLGAQKARDQERLSLFADVKDSDSWQRGNESCGRNVF
jgi:hypothetical protein